MKNYLDTTQNAEKAKELYRQGKTTGEIAKILGKAAITIKRYYGIAGGISMEDKAHHMMNRYIKIK